ncbi:MAG: GDP-mannose 4,6-dehydratase [Candidatus Thorarchaeota archaeon]
MSTILVTGGAGFIGSHLCENLLAEGLEVVCIDNFNDYYDSDIKRRNTTKCLEYSNFSLLEVDIRNYDTLAEIFKKNEIDKIVHLAARAGVIPSVEDPIATFENNVIGTQNILEICRNFGIEELTLASSSSVYGSRRDGPFKETDNVSSTSSPYAASKLMNETMASAYHSAYNLNISCLRFFTVYGPRQRPDMAIHTFVRKLLTRNQLEVYGNPDSSRDYTFVDDIISGVVSAMKLNKGFSIFNLGNSRPIKLGTLVDVIMDKTGIEIDVEWLPKRIGDVPMTFAEISHASAKLKYKPTTSIENGVEKFVEWYRDKFMPE